MKAIFSALVIASMTGFCTMFLLAIYESWGDGATIAARTRRIIGFSIAIGVVVFLTLLGWGGGMAGGLLTD